jgi:hypothetical protein
MNLQVFSFSRREDARSLREITCLLLNNSAGRFVYYFCELEELKIARLFLKVFGLFGGNAASIQDSLKIEPQNQDFLCVVACFFFSLSN